MQRRENTIRSRRLRGIVVIILSSIFLSTVTPGVHLVSAQTKPGIILSPSFAQLNINDTFTVTVFMTDFPDLYTFQVVLKYDGRILNLTDVTYPANYVFNRYQSYYQPVTSATRAAQSEGDSRDHLNWTVGGASIIGLNSVDVTNETLFVVDFTVIGVGQTTIAAASISDPIHTAGGHSWFTGAMTLQQAQYTGGQTNDFDFSGSTLLSGVLNAKPIATFTLSIPPVDNKTYYIMDRNAPPGAATWNNAYQGLPIYFNASGSSAPTGNITEYIWNFGDGNITTVNGTSAAGSFISHVYKAIGVFYMNLTVVASTMNSSLGIESLPATKLVLVGMVLQYYDWSWAIYAIFGIIAAAIVIVAARSVLRRTRIRRAEKKQKMLTARLPSGPSTGAQTT